MATLPRFDWPRFDWSLAFLANGSAPIAFLGRLGMSYVFILDGYGAIANAPGVAAYMEANGVSGKLLPLVIATELGGGLMVALGLGARWAAIALAGFCGLTAALFHANAADPEQVINFQKNCAMGGGFLLLATFGPGAWSLDAWLAKRRRAAERRAQQSERATIATPGQADAPKTR
jgi:putative oxidoreductase